LATFPRVGHFLDIPSWKRREHFELFRGMAQPFFSVAVDVDVTALYGRSRAKDGPSFFVTSLFNVMRAARETPAFCLRARGDRVWVHHALHMSTTVMRDDDTFAFAVFAPHESLVAFDESARVEIERARRATSLTIPTGDDIVYHSTLPWLRFTAFKNALGGTDTIPRVVFGKRFRDGDRWRMPVAVEVHHALVDGLDVARFIERLQSGLNERAG
jgi:chloramphenicol O-acetyltransferase type A